MIDAKPMVINDFLPEIIAEPLYTYVKNLKWNYGWRSTSEMGYAHWNCDIAGAERYNGLDISESIQDKEFVFQAWNFIKSAYLPEYDLIRCYANSHTHGVEGYPHTDSSRDQDVTVVIYMNKHWKREWHGETVIYDNDTIVQSALPAFNRAMIFKGNQTHCARALSRICPKLRRTIMFKCAKTGADPDRDKLQRFLKSVGAADKAHKKGSLACHLLSTYDLLKAAKQSNAVCLAGGAHSLYGTSFYKDACLAPDDQDSLRAVIGESALALVKLFATIARPLALEENADQSPEQLPLVDGGSVKITPEQFTELLAIEAANLYEQNSGIPKSFPKLQNFWSMIYNN